jgi:hypothetical protein
MQPASEVTGFAVYFCAPELILKQVLSNLFTLKAQGLLIIILFFILFIIITERVGLIGNAMYL